MSHHLSDSMSQMRDADKLSLLAKAKQAGSVYAMYQKSRQASLLQEIVSTDKGRFSRSVRRKLAAIRSKLMAGGRLTPEEKQFLRRYAPELYSRYLALEEQQQAAKRREKQLAAQKRLEKERQQTARKQREKEQQKADQTRRDRERHREEEDNARIQAYSKAAALSAARGPEGFSGYPVLSAPSEFTLAIAMTESAGQSPVALAYWEIPDTQEEIIWRSEGPDPRARNEAKMQEDETMPDGMAVQDRKETQEADMEWNRQEREEMEKLQEEAGAQAAQTRSFQGRAAYRTSVETTLPRTEEDGQKSCDRKA